MALGNILRKARESRKLTASQVASATHMKVQTVEAIEREDFSAMPAAIYCKGFIKLYAEHIGLDPDPLTREYVERFVAPPPEPEPEEPEDEPHIFNIGHNKKDDLPPIAREAEEEEEKDSHPDLFAYGAKRNEEPPEKLFDHPPPEEEQEEPTASKISEQLSNLKSKISEAASSITARFRRDTDAIEPAAPEPVEEIQMQSDAEVDVSPISLPNRQILIITGVVAGCILLIFLISVVARFLSGGDETVAPETPDQELVLPVEPPPPYID